MLDAFLDPSTTSLKICGVTRESDARQLAELGVDALGVNFWPKSKRFIEPPDAAFLKDLKGKILRVGVFVNATTDLAKQLVRDGLIDVVQLHGDEPESDIAILQTAGIPVIRALGLRTPADLQDALRFKSDALLLDAHAPGVYGGTGETIDWQAAADFIRNHRERPVILAGGITPDNAAEAVATVHPAALDVASGAESEPGIKDFQKVEALLAGVGH